MKYKSIDDIEKAVKELSLHELKEFRKWFYSYDQNAWDVQLQNDINSGKLDALVKEALNDYKSGNTSSL